MNVLKCDYGIDNCCHNKDGYCTDEETVKEGKTCIEVAAWMNNY